MKMEIEKATHTPGPWNVQYCIDGGFVIDGTSDGDHILIAQRAPIQRRMFEFEANARLIAAAPDLLAALQRIRESSGDPIIENICDAAIAKAEPE